MMTMYMTPYHRQLNRLAQNEQIARNFGATNSDVHIPLDVVDEKESFVIYAVIPGLAPEDVEIEILKNVVTIHGEFPQDDEAETIFLRRERPTGRFHRSLRFASNLESGNAEAKLENGVLSLRVPKVLEAQPKSIKVTTK